MNDSLFDHVPIDTTLNVPPPPDPLLDFLDILLPKNKGKNALAKENQQKDKKTGQKKDKTKKLTKKALTS